MAGSAYQAMDVLYIAIASYQRRVQRGDGSRMTGSAYQAMDVVSSCESYLQRRSAEEEMAVVF